MAPRTLVTGATGFVGTVLISALRARWTDAVILGLGTEDITHTVDGVNFAQVDLTDAEAVAAQVEAFEPDLVVHLAAQSSVTRGAVANDLTWRVNLSGSLHLALALVQFAPEAVLLFASSSEVYGANFLAGPIDETTKPCPMNAYAKSKLAAEQMFADVLLPTNRLIVARPFNHTGAGQRADFVLPAFAKQIAAIEAGRQTPVLSVGNIDVRRDFLDVRDVVAAYVALVDSAERLPRRFTVNIASGETHSLRGLLEVFRRLATRPFEIVVDPTKLRPVDLPVVSARPALLQAFTKWHRHHPIEETLKNILDAARTDERDLSASPMAV